MAENNIPDNQMEFNPNPRPSSTIRWIKWLYLAVGCFIVCLLIWMFMEITKDDVKKQEQEQIYQMEQSSPGLQLPSSTESQQ